MALAAPADSPAPEPAVSPRHRGSLAIYAALIVYSSLYPFGPLRVPGPEVFASILVARHVPWSDVVLNVLAYMPAGVLACLVFRRSMPPAHAMARAVGLGFALSLLMETCQLFITFRFASFADLAANTMGTVAGALAFAGPIHRALTRHLERWRERFVSEGIWGDAGLVLVGLWLLAQLNPALPFFEAGNIGLPEESETGRVVLAASVAMSVCGFGLFVSVVQRTAERAFRRVLFLLTVALWCKFVSASILLKPQLSAEWVTDTRMAGLAAGLAVCWPLLRLHRDTRIYCAALFLFAGAMLAKIFGTYSALGEVLRLFNKPYGQLATFTSLTRYLHESWPLLALAFLVALFVRDRLRPVR